MRHNHSNTASEIVKQLLMKFGEKVLQIVGFGGYRLGDVANSVTVLLSLFSRSNVPSPTKIPRSAAGM